MRLINFNLIFFILFYIKVWIIEISLLSLYKGNNNLKKGIMYKLIATNIELNHYDSDNEFSVYINEDENKFIAYENCENPKMFEYKLLVKPSNLNDKQCFEILEYCYGSGENDSEISYKELFLHSKFISLVGERTDFLIDLYSDLIEVVDLDEAIKQTELFVGFSKDEPKKILYYSDLLQKLKKFKNN